MRKLLFTALFGVTVMMAGCGPKSSANEPATVAEKAGEIAIAPESTGAATSETESLAENSFYGSWFVGALRGTSAVYALSQEEIESYIGTDLNYAADAYTWNGNSMDITGYEEATVTAEQFQTDFAVAFADLGIKSSEVTSVQIDAEGNLFGGYFYILDNDTLLVYYEGVFFEVDRE